MDNPNLLEISKGNLQGEGLLIKVAVTKWQ